LTAWPGMEKSSVSAICDKKFNPRISPKIDGKIERRWAEKRAANPRLYAQSKFRLGMLAEESGPIDIFREQPTSKVQRLTMGIGLTDYRQFVGTNQNESVKQIAVKENDRSMMSDLIGVNGVLITSDDFVLISRRAAWVGEHAGMLDTPGGHPEPSNLDHKFDMKRGEPLPDISCLESDAVVHEIFLSQKEEISVELNIPM